LALSIGCQTYTWEMLGDAYAGGPDDILDAIAEAGYDGCEFTNATIAKYAGRPGEFRLAVGGRGLRVAAFAFASTGFTDPARAEADLLGAGEALSFAAALRVPLCLGGPAAPTRDDYDASSGRAAGFYRAVAERGRGMGVTVCLHPHSHHGSLLETAEEYARMLDATADSGLMFNPDAGHIARSGMDVLACFAAHRDRIAYVHIKDVDAEGAWQPLGQGIIPWRELFGLLRETGYEGWITAEEESADAWGDPAGSVRRNVEFLRGLLG
jgi:inosose dehydratase